jgi:hypothetical protein
VPIDVGVAAAAERDDEIVIDRERSSLFRNTSLAHQR